MASEFFPAWYLGRNPDHYVIASTYAQELADDIQRYLAGQPVQAHPDSRLYRVGKFVRRHRIGVLAAWTALLYGLGTRLGDTVGEFNDRWGVRGMARGADVVHIHSALTDSAMPPSSSGTETPSPGPAR